MNDLGLDLQMVCTWFAGEKKASYTLFRINAEHSANWPDVLGLAVRRCYVTDAALEGRATESKVPQETIIAARLPDKGSTMAGDFGEILVYLYQGVQEQPRLARGATKWRLKQDRTKPAPYSDVVHFVLPSWPTPSEEDTILCAEVKTKSTAGTSTPISSALADIEKDRTSRLTKTLVWLRERALMEDLGDVNLEHLNRFINAIDHPPATRRFRAVAVVCTQLVEAELADAPKEPLADFEVVVISVPDLHSTYNSVFEVARHATIDTAAQATAGEN